MSRRSYSSSTLTETCSFWAMVISGFAYLLGGIIHFVISLLNNLGNTGAILARVVSIFTFIGNLALIVAVAIPAWQYVKYRSTAWKVVYWIALIGFALGAVLGMLGGLGIF